MSRAAKITLFASCIVSATTVWAVHYMQIQEREVMHKGVERDAERQAEKRRQRALDLEINKQKEEKFQKMQPTKGWLSSLTGGGGGGNAQKEENSSKSEPIR